MDEVEGSHWGFVGDARFWKVSASDLRKTPHSALRTPHFRCRLRYRGKSRNLSKFGEAEGVDISDDALEFCRRKGLKAQKGLAETLPFAM